MEDEPKLTYRIGGIGGGLIVSIAVVADLLQVLLSLTVVFALGDDIATIIAEGLIAFFLFIRGVNFFKGKKAFARVMSFFGETVIELVPFVDALPTLTAATIYQIHSTRVEDKLEFQEKHAAWEAAMERQIKREVANAQAAYQARLQRTRVLAANDNDSEEEYSEAA